MGTQDLSETNWKPLDTQTANPNSSKMNKKQIQEKVDKNETNYKGSCIKPFYTMK